MLNVFPSNTDVVVGDVDDEMLQVPQVTETQKKNKSQNTCIFTRSTLKILWEQKKKKTGQTY